MSIDQSGTNSEEVTGENGDSLRPEPLSLPDCLEDFEEDLGESEVDPEGIEGSGSTGNPSGDPLHRHLVWTGHLKQTPILTFTADAVFGVREPGMVSLSQRYHLTFKMMRNECKLVRSILEGHGLRECPSYINEYNLMWTGTHLKPYLLRGMMPFQRVNHFPRSYELTRKDRLFKNVQRMQHVKGFKHFDFLPHSYVMPHEYQDFCSAFIIDKGPYIVKPIASSRGRGIFLINHPDQLPFEDHTIVSKYINKPYLIDGFKFDIRLYVCVTCYDPLIIYLYEEGLVRFATVPYHSSHKHLDDQCMHLTNYSINKKSEQYVANDDADVEDFGNKWSLGALLRYLKCEGKDVAALMLRLEDVIIKAIVSVELPVSTACKMFQPHRGNCFELYGFDIILDETLRPWVLEVNLSPSLACDAPLDLKIKTHMISHLFNLIGVVCIDPVTQQTPNFTLPRMEQRRRPKPMNTARNQNKDRGGGGRGGGSGGSGGGGRRRVPSPFTPGSLSGEDLRMVRRAREEHQRRGGWLRIFPTRTSWDSYGSFLQSNNPSNLLLHQRLFPALWADRLARSAAANALNFAMPSLTSAALSKPKVPLHSLAHQPLLSQGDGCSNCSNCSNCEAVIPGSGLPPDLNRRVQQSYTCVKSRLSCYERKLGTPNGLRRNRNLQRTRRRSAGNNVRPDEAMVSGNTSAPTSVSGQAPEGSFACAEPLPGSETSMAQCADDTTSFLSDATSSQSTKVAALAEDVIDLDDYEALIARGGHMTKYQARLTFTAYLSSVQRRLLDESQERGPLTLEEEVVAAEQMDLVVKFLRRASNHMRQPYKVTVPSRRLPISQRKRVLSNVLNDFVHVYAKETVAMRLRMRATETNHGVNNKALISFLTNATEKELEQMLATYTHANQSAGIFLDATAEARTEAPLAKGRSSSVGEAPSKLRPTRRSRSATPRSSRNSSARRPRSRSLSAASPNCRSRSAETPPNARTTARSRTTSVDTKASAALGTARGRSRTRQTPLAPPTEVRRPRGLSRRRQGSVEEPRELLGSRTRLPATTLAIYSRRSGLSPPRVGRLDSRLPPALPASAVRRQQSGRQRRRDLSVENIYDKIRYEASTGISNLRRSPPMVRRLQAD